MLSFLNAVVQKTDAAIVKLKSEADGHESAFGVPSRDDIIQGIDKGTGRLEIASLEESLYPCPVPALDDNVVCEPVDNTFAVWEGEFGLKSLTQSINIAVNLLDTSQTHVAAALLQVVDGQFVGRRPGDKVGKIGSNFGFSESGSAGGYSGRAGQLVPLGWTIGVIADLCRLRSSVGSVRFERSRNGFEGCGRIRGRSSARGDEIWV